MKGVVACPGYMILQYEVKVSTELSDLFLLSIHDAEYSGIVQVDGVNIHVVVLGEGGCFVAHKPPREGADLI